MESSTPSRDTAWAMSEENVEIVRREYAAMTKRDWAAIAEVWHPEIELETDESAPGAGIYRGIEEITRFFETWSQPYGEFRVEAAEIRDLGDQVVVLERYSGRGLKGGESDAWLVAELARVISFRDGRIWRSKEYRTLEQALEAAGLSE